MPFSEVIGHARPLGLLARSLGRGTLPPSLLFSGPDGVGKRLVARAVSQALNCLSPAGSDACGHCTACRRIAAGTHPDVLVAEPSDTGVIKIEPVRALIAAAAYRPFEGRRRVIIIDDADHLNTDSQDALLKSLEEPGPSSVFILVSSKPETLLPTVRSRCARVNFGRLLAEDIARALVERHRYKADEAHAVAAIADGSLGRALDAGSTGYLEARAAALSALRTAAAGSSPRARLHAAGELLTGKSSPAAERDALTTRITLVGSLLRDLALVSQGGGAGRLANGDLAADLEELAPAFGCDRVLRGYAATGRAIAALDANANSKVVAAWLAVHL
jgi:DNA polymerase III subunit delta'